MDVMNNERTVHYLPDAVAFETMGSAGSIRPCERHRSETLFTLVWRVNRRERRRETKMSHATDFSNGS